MPEDGALAGRLVNQDIGGLAGAAGDFDQACFDAFARELLAL